MRVFRIADYKKELGSLSDIQLISVSNLLDDVSASFMTWARNEGLPPDVMDSLRDHYERTVEASMADADKMIRANRAKADKRR